MKKTTIAISALVAVTLSLATWLYRAAMPHGVLRPTKVMRATMQTKDYTIDGTVYRGKNWNLLYVRFPDSPSFSWFTVDMKNRFVAVPNGPRRIIGNLYRPMGIGVMLTSPKIQEKWSISVDQEIAVFSNDVVQCIVKKGASNN